MRHYRPAAMAATGYVLERLSELREEAYCKVLRCFLASQQYDLVSFHNPVHLSYIISISSTCGIFCIRAEQEYACKVPHQGAGAVSSLWGCTLNRPALRCYGCMLLGSGRQSAALKGVCRMVIMNEEQGVGAFSAVEGAVHLGRVPQGAAPALRWAKAS